MSSYRTHPLHVYLRLCHDFCRCGLAATNFPFPAQATAQILTYRQCLFTHVHDAGSSRASLHSGLSEAHAPCSFLIFTLSCTSASFSSLAQCSLFYVPYVAVMLSSGLT